MNTNDPKFSKDPREQKPFGSKGNGTRDTRKIDELYSYANSNREQTISYVLLAVGLLILLFFNNLLGGLIIGMVAGWFFAPEIIYYVRNIDQVFRGQDQLRYVILTTLVLGLFIAAPGIFIGATIVAIFKQIIAGAVNSPPKS